MLGACGVMMGSRFYVAQESLAPPEAKSKAINGSGDDTIRSSVFDVLRQFDWPKPYNLRTLKNQLSERWRNDIAGLKQTEQHAIEDYEQAVLAKNYDKAPVIVGEAIDLIHHESTSEEIIADIIDRTAECLQSTRKLLST